MAVTAFRPRRQYSFTDHATANPSVPPPGDRIDGEIDRLDKTLAVLTQLVSSSLNPDGTLKPGTVGKSQLKPGVFDVPAVTPAVVPAPYTIEARDADDAAAAAEAAATAAANSADHALGSEILGAKYSTLTQAWAEFMPTPIPPNILAEMDVTGDHWSSRWWAHRAYEIVLAGNQLPHVQAPPAVAIKIDTVPWHFDGITRTFPLRDVLGVVVAPPSAADCIVSVNGIVQEPFTQFNVRAGYIDFADPPEADAVGWMVVGLAQGTPGSSGMSQTGILLGKMSRDPLEGPGTGFAALYVIEDGAGHAILRMQAGTSPTPLSVAVNVGAGFDGEGSASVVLALLAGDPTTPPGVGQVMLYATQGANGNGKADLKIMAGTSLVPVTIATGVGNGAVSGANPLPLRLQRIESDPTTPPGAGLALLYAIPGLNNTARLRMQAGTSISAVDVAVNVGREF